MRKQNKNFRNTDRQLISKGDEFAKLQRGEWNQKLEVKQWQYQNRHYKQSIIK